MHLSAGFLGGEPRKDDQAPAPPRSVTHADSHGAGVRREGEPQVGESLRARRRRRAVRWQVVVQPCDVRHLDLGFRMVDSGT